jgi:hypothetical protein
VDEIKPVLAKFLAAQAPKIAAQLSKSLGLGKAGDDEDSVDKALKSLDFSDWEGLPPLLTDALAGVAVGAGNQALKNLDLFSDDVSKLMAARATAYAQQRAAEMVGMKVNDSGDLIPNPDAKWQITEGTRTLLRSTVEQAEAEGWSTSKLSSAIQEGTVFSEDRADMIARTESAFADTRGNIEGWRASGVVDQKEFLAAPDCCDECQDIDGEIVDLDDNFSDGSDGAPLHPNCFPAGTQVTARGIVTAVTTRWYEGELAGFRTASGKFVSATVNHPILTDRGWIAAGALNESSRVISRAASYDGVLDDDDQDVPTSIEEVARAFMESRGVATVEVPVTAIDFHGDGLGSEVAVVSTNGALRSAADAASVEHLVKRGFVLRLKTFRSMLARRCADLQSLLTGSGSAYGIVGFNDLGFALLGAHALPLDGLGFALSAMSNASSEKRSIDGAARDRELATQIIDGSTGPVFADQVVEIWRVPFAGHVFNLESSEGHYTANGVVSHNCRCSVLPVLSDE